MIFPRLKLDKILQVDDLMRLDASKSTATPDEGNIINVEISFDGGGTFIQIYNINKSKWYIDYAYDSDGTKNVKLKITTDSGSAEKDFSVDVVTVEDDKLFSDDAEVFDLEGELLGLMPKGRSSYKYMHRKARNMIIRYLDGEGVRKKDGEAFAKEDLYENIYVQEFSLYQTMALIFEDLTVRVGDKFKNKSKVYYGHLARARKNAKLRLDFNQDGETENNESKNLQQKFLGR